MNQSTVFYTGLRGVETVPGRSKKQPYPGPDTSMTGMLDDGMLESYDGLPQTPNERQTRGSTTSLNSLMSTDYEPTRRAGNVEPSQGEVAVQGTNAGPPLASFGAQPAQGTSNTLTDFTKRRNWSHKVVEELEDLIQILTPNGRFKYLSPSCEKLTGYTQDELADKFIVDYVHADDSTIFQREFNESIASGNALRFFYRFRKKDDSYAIFECHGHPHLASGASQLGAYSGAGYCRGFFMMARRYPTKNASLLDSFLEHKVENERLTRRINDLKREEAEELEENRKNFPQGRPGTHSEQPETMASSSSTPVQSRAPDLLNMLPPAKLTDLNAALTRQNLEDATASNEPDSMQDKMARYEGATHIETIEMLTGLRYQEGERSQGVSTGDTEPMLFKGDAAIAIPIDKDVRGDKKKKLKMPDEYVCTDCGTLESPEWRKGPTGPKTLCNACGLRWAKKEKRSKTGP